MNISPALKKFVMPNLPYLMFLWVFAKLACAFRIAPGADFGVKLLGSVSTLGSVMEKPLAGFAATDLLIGLIGAAIVCAIVYFKGKNAKKYRKGIEYGSARWGNANDIRPYVDPIFEKNVILTQTESLMMNSRPYSPKYARNKNVLMIGGSGSGKTRFFLKPNLMQMHSSYVITDPKGLVCGGQLFK